MIKKNISPYLKTFFISLLFIVLTVIFVLIFNIENYKFQSKKYLTVKDENKVALINKSYNYLIEKYKYLSTQEPTNYKHNLNQGFLYELSGEREQAISQYLLAIKKSNSLELEPIFRLINIYLSQKDFDKADELASKIVNGNYKDSDFLLAGYYQTYGDILFQDKDFHQALEKYKLAIEIYNKSKIGKPPEKLLNSISTTYQKLADKAVENNDLKRAIDELHQSALYANQGIAYYKLAILYMELDKNKALKYFDITFKTKPEIINYDLYSLLINDFIEESVAKNKFTLTKHYQDKLNLIRRFEKYNLIKDKDFLITADKNSLIYDIKEQNKFIKLKLNIKNNTTIPLKTLYFTFTVKVNGVIISAYKLKVIPKSKESDLILGDINVKIPIGEPLLLNSTEPAKIEVYLSKNAKIEPKLVKTFDIITKQAK